MSKLYDQLKKAALQREDKAGTEGEPTGQPQPGGLLARALQRAEAERNRAHNQQQLKQSAAAEREDREAARALDQRVESERHAAQAAQARADADRKNTEHATRRAEAARKALEAAQARGAAEEAAAAAH